MEDEEKNLDPTAKIDINPDTYKWATIALVKRMLEVSQLGNYEELGETFAQHYESILQAHVHEDLTDLARYYRLITAFKPALSKILKLGKEYDQICDYAVQQFNVALNRIRSQLEEDRPIPKKGPILPGTNTSILLKYFCRTCNQEFEIPPEKQAEILSSEEKMPLPTHCGHEMEIRMSRVKEEKAAPQEEAKKKKKKKKITIYPAELLMGHADSAEANVEYLKLLSVGIDIGSSTSHLVFSRLTLRRETGFFNLTNRFLLVDRDLIYEGNIIFTPLLDRSTIDIEAIIAFCEAEYKKAAITPEMVDTGAVIVTGETAKKQNAAEIVRRLSSESGKFVSASAGPNFESLLGAMGSGSVHQSLELQNTILNADVGGGTSNLAISSKGDVLSCACINVGGRLLGIDENFKIWRIDGPTEFLLKELKMEHQLGDTIPEDDARLIAREYAKALVEVLQGPATSTITKVLMMTDDLDYSTTIDGFSFSGGIGEMIYGTETESTTYNDIGHYLAEEIVLLMKQHNLPLIEPENKIRATVIGAGAFSLSISGSTCYIDKDFTLPLNNIPVVPVHLTRDNFSPEKVIEEVNRAYAKFDMQEGTDVVGLFFKDAIYPTEELLSVFAKALEQALPNSVAQHKPIILLFQGDLAKLLGLSIHRETSIKSNLLCLDELILETGDWIDIGASLHEPPRQAFPVTVKSLVFNQDKKRAQNFLKK